MRTKTFELPCDLLEKSILLEVLNVHIRILAATRRVRDASTENDKKSTGSMNTVWNGKEARLERTGKLQVFYLTWVAYWNGIQVYSQGSSFSFRSQNPPSLFFEKHIIHLSIPPSEHTLVFFSNEIQLSEIAC